MSNMTEYYVEFVTRLKAKFNSFMLDAEAAIENKSAALRARKLSMELRQDLKDFKQLSTQHDKAITASRKSDSAD